MRDCTICVAKTKALISCAVTLQLICVFVFAYAKRRFSQDEAPLETAFLIANCGQLVTSVFKNELPRMFLSKQSDQSLQCFFICSAILETFL